jgi:hypothetical protein
MHGLENTEAALCTLGCLTYAFRVALHRTMREQYRMMRKEVSSRCGEERDCEPCSTSD